MSQLNEITFYQLENLILQKVPFKFIDLHSTNEASSNEIHEAFKHLNPYYLRFFKEQFVEMTSQNTLEEINLLKLSLETPFILLCKDGQHSSKKASELEAFGYKNIYVLTGGLQQLLKDANN